MNALCTMNILIKTKEIGAYVIHLETPYGGWK
jgi:hypothetical protein